MCDVKLNQIKEKLKSLWNKPVASVDEVLRQEHDFYINYVKPGMIIFDIGAHVGEISLLFSRSVGQTGHVHSFEANSDTCEEFKNRCNMSKNITLNHRAVSDINSIVRLHQYDSAHSSWNSLALRPLKKYGIDMVPVGVHEVASVTVDTYCEKSRITEIDLLKVDVEGAEFQVLRGAKRMFLEHKIRCCIFEFGQTTFDMGNSPDMIESFMHKVGYQVDNIIVGDPKYPMDKSGELAEFAMHIARPKV